MDQILDLPSTAQRRLNYAGFWIRLVAFIIDYFVVSIILWIISTLFGFGMFMTPAEASIPLIIGLLVAMLIGFIGYFVAMESSSLQATLGKMAVGIMVGRANGERISGLNALGRWFAKVLSWMILWIGYIIAGFDPKKQALHDKMAGTYVFYKQY